MCTELTYLFYFSLTTFCTIWTKNITEIGLYDRKEQKQPRLKLCLWNISIYLIRDSLIKIINVTKLSKEGDKEENQYEEKLDGVGPVENRPSTD